MKGVLQKVNPAGVASAPPTLGAAKMPNISTIEFKEALPADMRKDFIEEVDADHNGTITVPEIVKLFESNHKKKHDISVMRNALATALFFLLMSILANLGTAWYAVEQSRQTSTGYPDQGAGTVGGPEVTEKSSGRQVLVAESGQVIMAGMLQALVRFGTMGALKGAPELLTIFDEGAQPFHQQTNTTFKGKYQAMRINQVSFIPPQTVELITTVGWTVVIEGALNGTVYIPVTADSSKRSFKFCAACAPMEMRSLLKNQKYEDAMADFKAEAEAESSSGPGSYCDQNVPGPAKQASSFAFFPPAAKPSICGHAIHPYDGQVQLNTEARTVRESWKNLRGEGRNRRSLKQCKSCE